MNDVMLGGAVAAIFLGGVLVGFGLRSLPRHAPGPAAAAEGTPPRSVPTLRGEVIPLALPAADPKPGDIVYALASATDNYAIVRGTVTGVGADTVRIAEIPEMPIAAELVFAAKRDAQREAHLRLERLVRALGALPPRASDDARRRELDARIAALRRLEAEMSAGDGAGA